MEQGLGAGAGESSQGKGRPWGRAGQGRAGQARAGQAGQASGVHPAGITLGAPLAGGRLGVVSASWWAVWLGRLAHLAGLI